MRSGLELITLLSKQPLYSLLKDKSGRQEAWAFHTQDTAKGESLGEPGVLRTLEAA